MSRKYDGKKLLMLGCNAGSAEIVKYAKENGAYTVVSDYTPYEKSELKHISDDHIQISTSDTDALADYIKSEHISGVIAGISEFNLRQAMLLSEICGLPYYCTREQWGFVENKMNFRRLCEQFGVPCPKVYDRSPEFPCLVKPVDSNSSCGVYICRSNAELDGHIRDALSFSSEKKVIIEEFVEGVEFTAHYTIAGGKAALSSVDNRYPARVHPNAFLTLPIARIYPSFFLDNYIKQVNPPMLTLCESLGLTDALLFVQGIYDPGRDRFCIFEAGLRSAAETPFRFASIVNGSNPMQVIIDHNLTGRSDYDLSKEDPRFKNKCCGIVSFITRGGTVGKIIGTEETVGHLPSVVGFERRYSEGDKTPDTDTLRQIFMRFVMVCDDRESMIRDIGYINSHTDVLDDGGKSLVIKIDPERIRGLI